MESNRTLGPIIFLIIVVLGIIFMLNLLIGFLGTAVDEAKSVITDQEKYRSAQDELSLKLKTMKEYRLRLQKTIDMDKPHEP